MSKSHFNTTIFRSVLILIAMITLTSTLAGNKSRQAKHEVSRRPAIVGTTEAVKPMIEIPQ